MLVEWEKKYFLVCKQNKSRYDMDKVHKLFEQADRFLEFYGLNRYVHIMTFSMGRDCNYAMLDCYLSGGSTYNICLLFRETTVNSGEFALRTNMLSVVDDLLLGAVRISCSRRDMLEKFGRKVARPQSFYNG